jgi:hypothetical protein
LERMWINVVKVSFKILSGHSLKKLRKPTKKIRISSILAEN